MGRLRWMIVCIGLVAMLMFSCIAVSNVVGSRQVSYSKNYTDPTGDPYNIGVPETQEKDSDITSTKSSESEGKVTLEVSVVGTVYATSEGMPEGFSYMYMYYIDVNNDKEEDWTLTKMSVMCTLSDDEDSVYEMISDDDISGDGTNTLSISFSLSIIEEVDTITGWDFAAQIMVTDLSDYSTSTDWAPDDTWAFEDGGDGGDGDVDGDGDGDGTSETWTLTISGTTFDMSCSSESYSGTYTTDDTVTPNQIDFSITDSSTVALGIYELSGNTLKLCFSEPGNTNRPTTLSGTGVTRSWEMTRQGTGTGLEDIWSGPETTGQTDGTDGADGDGDGDSDDKDEDKGFLPGFEVVVLLAAIGTILIVSRKILK